MRSILTIVIITGLVLMAADALQAAGFEIAEQSARGLGNAYAGKAAEADDPAIAFFNPAGMTKLTGLQGAVTAQILVAAGTFESRGSTGTALVIPGGLTSSEPCGDDGGDPGGVNLIPCANIVMSIGGGFSLGLTANSPYGLSTSYDEDWMGRYHALESSIETISVNPSIAYRVNEQFSIGGGFSVQQAEAELSNAIDFGTIALGGVRPGGMTMQQYLGAGLSPEANDGEVVITGDSIGYGWNAGVLFELTENTRFGLAYRSKISHVLEGKADFTVPSNAERVVTSRGWFTDTDATARVTLPEQVYLSAYHDFNEQWAILADVTWTRWSRFEELRVTYDSPQDDSVTEEKWNDVFRYSLGATYRPDDEWCVRVGVAFDQSPIPNEYRTPRIPTGDRFWWSMGIGYKISESMLLDLSWMHVFIQNGSIDQEAATGQELKGDFEGSAYVIGLNFIMGF